MSRRSRRAGLAVALACTLPAVAAAQPAVAAAAQADTASWSHFEWLDRQPTVDPTLAGDQRGDAVAAWTTEHEAFAARRSRAGQFGAPVRLLLRATSTPRVFAAGIDERGDSFVGIDDFGRHDCCPIRVAIARDGRAFGRARTVSTPGDYASDPKLAVGRNGDAIVTWQVGGLLEAAVGDALHGFAPPRVIGPAAVLCGQTVVPAMGAGGYPQLLETVATRDRQRLLGRRGDRDGAFAARYELASTTTADNCPAAFLAPELAPGPAGGGIAAWTGLVRHGPGCCDSDERVVAATWRPGGHGVRIQPLWTVDSSTAPSLAASREGRAIVASPVAGGIGIGERLPGGRFELRPGLRAIPLCCPSSPVLSLATNRAGAAVIAWEGFDPRSGGHSGRVALRSPDGSFQPVHRFRLNLSSWTQYGGYPYTLNRVVTIDAHGRASVMLSPEGSVGVAVASYRP
jgi:hypothetical protein